MIPSRVRVLFLALAVACASLAAGGTAAAQGGDTKPPGKVPDVTGKKALRALQVKLPAGWKDDGTVLGERRFLKDKMIFFAALHSGPVPARPEALANMTVTNPNLFPGRIW